MGKLGGFSYKDVIKILKSLGFEFHRQAAGSHEIWYNSSSNKFTTIPNHKGDLPEGTLSSILKQANGTTEDFLKKKK